jgi:hypothetical protein
VLGEGAGIPGPWLGEAARSNSTPALVNPTPRTL